MVAGRRPTAPWRATALVVATGLGALVVGLGPAAGCSPGAEPTVVPPSSAERSSATTGSGGVLPQPPAATGDHGSASASPPAAPASAAMVASDDPARDASQLRGPKPIDGARAAALMQLDPAASATRGCLELGAPREQVRCLVQGWLADDKLAQRRALELYDHSGGVVGVEPEQLFDGGWRGTIRLVPHRPTGAQRRHLDWVVGATEDFERFFGLLAAGEPERLRFVWRPLAFRFFRSVGRTTPSAYADEWQVSYNVSGSLHSSANAVRDTLFHEIFHLNDAAHGGWSARVLPALVEPVLARCRRAGDRLDTACLAPFAPGSTMVRGGTYYAFQPGNGVWEYAAELASRYFREQRTVLRLPDGQTGRPFKCGPEPNARAWKLLVDEFFGGIDRTGACP